MMPKDRRIAIAPTWATTRYRNAALLFSGRSSSKSTRKYEAAAIISQAMRKNRASSAKTTRNIPARKKT
jgi:hypothetical protein